MPFGLKNAPPTFQRIIHHILKQFLFKFVVAYLDDFLVFSLSEEEHFHHLQLVFQKLAEYNVTLSLNKCYFFQKEVHYLGHLTSHQSFRPSPNLISSIGKFPHPTDIKSVQRFIGLSGYFRKFIPGYSVTAAPLTDLLKKNSAFVWVNKHEDAFKKLKTALTSDAVLGGYDHRLPTYLHTDACGIGLGAMLVQTDQGRERVIGYFSCKFNEQQRRYHTTEQECLAVVDSIQHFHIYLYGIRFIVITDHSALKWLEKTKEKNNRLYRWSVKLSSYDYTVVHKPGRLNSVPDVLSRAPIDQDVHVCHASASFIFQLQRHLSVGEKADAIVRDNLYLDS